MALMGVDEARDRMTGAVAAMPAETVVLDEAVGRVLAAPVIAQRDQPPFDASAMDGWAVRASDELAARTIVGESAAGRAFAGAVGPGEAVRIFTGAAVPVGADHVVMQENARHDGHCLHIKVLGKANMRHRGKEFRCGSTLLQAGRMINGPRASVIAAVGAGKVSVRRRPAVAILATGDELVAPGREAGADQIYESVSFGVAGLVGGWGGRARRVATLADTSEAVVVAIRDTLATCDLVVVVGGASVGDYDFARAAVSGEGARILVDKVAIRPGKPVWFGVTGAAPILGLPGNPASALVCARIFLRPLIETMLAVHADDRAAPFPAALGAALPANGDRSHCLRARVVPNVEGRLTAWPAVDQDSAQVLPFVTCNGLLIQPPHAPASPAGALSNCLWV